MGQFVTGASYTPSVDEKTTQLEMYGEEKFRNGVSDKVPMTEIDLNDSATQANDISNGDVTQMKNVSIGSEEKYTPGCNTYDTYMIYHLVSRRLSANCNISQ